MQAQFWTKGFTWCKHQCCWVVLVEWSSSQTGSQSNSHPSTLRIDCSHLEWKSDWKLVSRFSPMWEPTRRTRIKEKTSRKERTRWAFTWKLGSGSQDLKQIWFTGSSFSSSCMRLLLLASLVLRHTWGLLLFASCYYFISLTSIALLPLLFFSLCCYYLSLLLFLSSCCYSSQFSSILTKVILGKLSFLELFYAEPKWQVWN